MMAIKKLPREVLQDIVSYLPNRCTNWKDLLNCSQTCRSFRDAATPAIYRDVNLQCIHDLDQEVNEKTDRRQLNFMKSIAENPKLGTLVRTFVNDSDPYAGGRDVTQRSETDKSLLFDAAKNMKGLCKASFSTNPLAVQVVTNLPSYPQLSDLTLNGFIPTKHVWANAQAPLKSLTWKINTLRSPEGPVSLAEVRFLLRVLEETCPDLELLDLSLGDPYSRSASNADVATVPRVDAYVSLSEKPEANMTRLRHFGLSTRSSGVENHDEEIKAFILEVVEKYGHLLQSITIPGGTHEWTRGGLDFVLKVCALVPGLRELNLSKGYIGSGSALTAHEAFHELTTSPATANIERFSTMNIQGHFSKEIGELFGFWKNLKFLQVGDEDNSGGPFGDDGRPQFDDYRPHIMAFIQALPTSLQELYLEINGQDICCDDDEDFDPLCTMSPEIFHALPRLHTCDIQAWISNLDGGLGSIPEKGVFYRRLPSDALHPKERTIWFSRMDCIYQDEDILVKKRSSLVEDEAFEGEDAKEVWLGGATFSRMRRGTSRGSPPGRPDWSWPFCEDLLQTKIENYEMWRARY
ncbi:hypothetical protein BKA64DRAFT_716437 [Cadophora sp. MPI-SDFR-AT-0126]|nr:hypothetical protein BKA64DRAFT_716437 [Leotiomycetes sp. MPI-SDFR-AT-0126]